jgi:uncharacterized integral membrane protein
MLNRLVLVVIFVPLAVVLIAFSVANRGLTAITLDPFNPGNPALTLSLPLFVWLFLALAVGIVVGGAATWARQSEWRRLARRRGKEAETLRQAAARGDATPPPPSSTARPGAFAALPKPSA